MKLKLLLIVVAVSLLVFSLAYANGEEQEPEKIEITTYYPAPYGDYDELSANRVTADGVTYSPISGSPDFWPDDAEGTVRYSANEDDLFYFNGDKWVTSWAGASSASSGGSVTVLGVDAVPSCPEGWKSAYSGYYACPVTLSYGSSLHTPTGTCFCAPINVGFYISTTTTGTYYNSAFYRDGDGNKYSLRCNVCVK